MSSHLHRMALLLLVLPALTAQAEVITFEGGITGIYEPRGDPNHSQHGWAAHLLVQGFEFYTVGYGRFAQPDGHDGLRPYNSDVPGARFMQSFNLKRPDGARFNLVSMDVRAEVDNPPGVFTDLGIALAQSDHLAAVPVDGELHSLTLNWNDLSHAHFVFSRYNESDLDPHNHIDMWFSNFVLTPAVPEPASASLLALGLLVGSAAFGLNRRHIGGPPTAKPGH